MVPGTFLIDKIDTSFYTLDWINASLQFKKKLPAVDSVQVKYRVFNEKLNAVTQRYQVRQH